MGAEAGCAHEKGQRLAECRALAFGFRGGAFQKRGLSWPALYRSAVAGLPFLFDIRGRAISRRGVNPCFDRYQK